MHSQVRTCLLCSVLCLFTAALSIVWMKHDWFECTEPGEPDETTSASGVAHPPPPLRHHIRHGHGIYTDQEGEVHCELSTHIISALTGR